MSIHTERTDTRAATDRWFFGYRLAKLARASATSESELAAILRLESWTGSTDDYRTGCKLLESSDPHASRALLAMIEPSEAPALESVALTVRP
jgi:hypothetical protein